MALEGLLDMLPAWFKALGALYAAALVLRALACVARHVAERIWRPWAYRRRVQALIEANAELARAWHQLALLEREFRRQHGEE